MFCDYQRRDYQLPYVESVIIPLSAISETTNQNVTLKLETMQEIYLCPMRTSQRCQLRGRIR